MKRKFVASLVMVLLVSLYGCGNSTSTEENKDKTSTATKTIESSSVYSNVSKSEIEELNTEKSSTLITYNSEALKIAFDMPASWEGKYRVVEREDTLSVYYISDYESSAGYGRLFAISKLKDEDDVGFYDSVPGVEKVQTINGTKFVLGAPTDFPFLQEDPNFNDFMSTNKEVPQVLKSLRGI